MRSPRLCIPGLFLATAMVGQTVQPAPHIRTQRHVERNQRGQAALRAGQLQQAATVFAEACRTWPRLSREGLAEWAKSWHYLAYASSSLGDENGASTCYSVAVALRWALGDRMRLATSLHGLVGAVRDRYPQWALAAATTALRIRRERLAPDDYRVGNAIVAVGSCHVSLRQPNQARHSFERAIETLEPAIDDHQDHGPNCKQITPLRKAHAMALAGLAHAHRLSHRYGEALQASVRNIAVVEAAFGTKSRQATIARANAAGFALEAGDFRSARRQLDDLLPRIGPRDGILPTLLLNRSACLREETDPDAALADARRALRILEQRRGANPLQIANVETAIGTLLDELGAHDEALAHHLRGLELCRTTSAAPRHLLILMLKNTAVCYLNLGEDWTGERLLTEARVLAARTPTSERGPILADLSTALRGLGRIEEAADLATRALPMTERVLGERHPRSLTVRQTASTFLLEAQRVREARALLIRYVELGTASQLPKDEILVARAHRVLADYQLGQEAAATTEMETLLATAAELESSMRPTFRREVLRVAARIAVSQGNLARAEELADRLWQISEPSDSGTLGLCGWVHLTAGSLAKAKQRFEQAIREYRRTKVRASVLRAGDRAIYLDGALGPDPFRGLATVAARSNDAAGFLAAMEEVRGQFVLDVLEEARVPGGSPRGNPTRNLIPTEPTNDPSIESVRSTVESREPILYYCIGPEESHVAYLGEGGPRLEELKWPNGDAVGRDELAGLVQRYREDLEARPKSHFPGARGSGEADSRSRATDCS